MPNGTYYSLCREQIWDQERSEIYPVVDSTYISISLMNWSLLFLEAGTVISTTFNSIYRRSSNEKGTISKSLILRVNHKRITVYCQCSFFVINNHSQAFIKMSI
jgi:hypothetical protein